MRLPRGLAPLRHRDFRLLTSGQLASNAGDALYAVALPWYVLAVHGGALVLGTVLAAYGVARCVTLAIGGRVGDHFKPWTVMLIADVVRTLAIAALAVVAALRPAGVAVLLPISIVLGAGDGMFLPASFSIVASLVPDGDLQAGNALSSGGTQLATLVGPAAGGAVVALLGASPAFAIDGVTFLVSILSLSRIRAGRRAAAAPAPAPGEPPGDSRTMWQIVRDEPILTLVLGVTLAANLGNGGMGEVALPALAHGPLHAGAGGYGALLAAFGGGALVGTLVTAQVSSASRPAIAGSLAFLGDAVCFGFIPYAGGTVGAGVLFALGGALNAYGNVNTQTAFQRWAPAGTIGRLSSVLLLASFGTFPLSVILGGLVVHSFGPAVFFPLGSAPLFAAVLYALSRRSWRDFGRAVAPAA